MEITFTPEKNLIVEFVQYRMVDMKISPDDP